MAVRVATHLQSELVDVDPGAERGSNRFVVRLKND
jgi:hypothetical protein